MTILRAKTLGLRQVVGLTPKQADNSALNEKEALAGVLSPLSRPRRLVFEMTNTCNINCLTCGRNAATFKPTFFDPKWRDFFLGISPYVEEVTLMGWGEPTVHPQFVDFLYWAYKNKLRKYFCTNGMKIKDHMADIFSAQCDIIAISFDGATAETCERLRRGADFHKIVADLKKLMGEKKHLNTNWPYVNFVFTALNSNLDEFPQLINLAADIGLDEVKLVYFTAFDPALLGETLFGQGQRVFDVFEKAKEVAKKNGVALKLPHLEGEDPAGTKAHKPCYAPWRDCFLGSDGFFRPCMSTAEKFVHISQTPDFETLWQADFYQQFRAQVNGSSPLG
ncbi:MAG: radical SAM/SPASM domain-containing protein, partial [Candidatus Adiutrix sp.]